MSASSSALMASRAPATTRATAALSSRARVRRASRSARASTTTFTTRAAIAEPEPVTEVNNSEIELFEGKKRLQTQTSVIGPDTTCIRSLDWDRDRFDIEFGLEKGTTYNSYVIKGSEKTALVDASHEKFKQLYIDTLAGVVDLKDIDYIVCSHTEPDHSGLIGPILDLAPNATVVGSKVCLKFLEDLVQKPFAQRVVKGGDVIDLGGGHELKYIMAPNLHWPDTMFTYDPASRLIYTCDAFGSHYCTEEMYIQFVRMGGGKALEAVPLSARTEPILRAAAAVDVARARGRRAHPAQGLHLDHGAQRTPRDDLARPGRGPAVAAAGRDARQQALVGGVERDRQDFKAGHRLARRTERRHSVARRL